MRVGHFNVPRHTYIIGTPAGVGLSIVYKYICDLTCKLGSVGQSEGLLVPRSSVRFRPQPRQYQIPMELENFVATNFVATLNH